MSTGFIYFKGYYEDKKHVIPACSYTPLHSLRTCATSSAHCTTRQWRVRSARCLEAWSRSNTCSPRDCRTGTRRYSFWSIAQPPRPDLGPIPEMRLILCMREIVVLSNRQIDSQTNWQHQLSIADQCGQGEGLWGTGTACRCRTHHRAITTDSGGAVVLSLFGWPTIKTLHVCLCVDKQLVWFVSQYKGHKTVIWTSGSSSSQHARSSDSVTSTAFFLHAHSMSSKYVCGFSLRPPLWFIYHSTFMWFDIMTRYNIYERYVFVNLLVRRMKAWQDIKHL